MTIHPKHLLLASLLAAAGTLAVAQSTPPASASPAATSAAPQPGADQRQQRRAERMGERHAKRMSQLKADLKLTPAQEGAWSTYADAMQPRAQGPRVNRGEMASLTTPQRIERMQTLQAERQQRMTQRLDAVKAFYAHLNPDQQKVYDQQSMHFGQGEGKGHGGHRGGRHGMHRG